jgi:hypothetical protein
MWEIEAAESLETYTRRVATFLTEKERTADEADADQLDLF